MSEPLGLLRTAANDWKIAFVGQKGFAFAFGYHFFSFMLASGSAKIMVPIYFAGGSISLGLDIGGVAGRTFDIISKMDELRKEFFSPKQKSFFPLRIVKSRPFSANDLDYGVGRMGFYSVLTDRFVRFHAVKRGILSSEKSARLFEHPGEGLPLSSQGVGTLAVT